MERTSDNFYLLDCLISYNHCESWTFFACFRLSAGQPKAANSRDALLWYFQLLIIIPLLNHQWSSCMGSNKLITIALICPCPWILNHSVFMYAALVIRNFIASMSEAMWQAFLSISCPFSSVRAKFHPFHPGKAVCPSGPWVMMTNKSLWVRVDQFVQSYSSASLKASQVIIKECL